MDFHELLSVANNNEIEAKHEASKKRYSTSFAPLKKHPKSNVQSEQIKQFLAKKEAEERRKAEEAQKKKEQLLALRAQSTKNNKKAKIMASRTKDNDFSKIKLTEDELEAKKKRERELQALELENKRERMKARIELAEKEKLLPRKRKRKDKASNPDGESHNTVSETVSDDDDFVKPNKMQPTEQKKIPKKRPPPPPPMDFNDLLKVASVKQFQPIELKMVEKKEERPLTKKAKLALQEEEERLRRKMAAAAAKNNPDTNYRPNGVAPKNQKIPNSSSSSSLHFNKINKPVNSSRTQPTVIQLQSADKSKSKPKPPVKKTIDESYRDNIKSNNSFSAKQNLNYNQPPKMSTQTTNGLKKNLQSGKIRDDQHFLQNRSIPSNPQAKKNSNIVKKSLPSVKLKEDPNFLEPTPKTGNIIKKTETKSISHNNSINQKSDSPSINLNEDMIAQIEKRIREKMEKEITERLQRQLSEKLERYPVSSNRTDKQSEKSNFKKPSVNPRDLPVKQNAVKKETKRPFHPNPYVLPPRRLLEPSRPKSKPPIKRRIESDDEDDDDDLDGFIDNSCIESEDYSKYIKEIFQYDRSRYADDDDDIEVASFAQVDAEERRSAKLGYLEDLEEERKERDELRRKAMKKKKN